MSTLSEKVLAFTKIGESIPVCLSTAQGAVKDGTAYVQRWNPSQRMRRAVKALAITWGLAILAVFIPILHFLLVPILIILGPILASINYNKNSVILGGNAICPNCDNEFEIVRAADRWPLSDICSICHQHVTISKM